MRLSEAYTYIRSKPRLQLFLALSLILQLIIAWRQVGYWHPDQHFQIIEFGMEWLGESSAVSEIWEHESEIRPSLPVYCYALWHKGMKLLGFESHIDIHTSVRLVHALVQWLLAHLLILSLCRDESEWDTTIALVLTSCLWHMPYLRSLFSSEMLGALCFFTGVLQRERRIWLTGLLFAASFFMRFQMAFAILGYLVYLLAFAKMSRGAWFTLVLSGALGGALGVLLDCAYYGHFVLTPWEYFSSNIIEGVAASFGTSPWYYYIIEILLSYSVPIFGLVLLPWALMAWTKVWQHWVVWVLIFFVIGHSLVGHKEERFFYPMFVLLPWLAMLAWQEYRAYTSRYPRALLDICVKALLGLGLLINIVTLIFWATVAYCQPVHFAERLQKDLVRTNYSGVIHYNQQSPLQTPSRLSLVYYGLDYPEAVQLVRVDKLDELESGEETLYLVSNSKYLHRKANGTLDPCFEPIMYSSRWLWRINEWMMQQGYGNIDDIWVMYRCSAEG